MSHLHELCPKDCVFDASEPVEKENACDHCWMSEVNFIHPALQAIDAWGHEGEVIAETPKEYFFKTIMSNGRPSIGTLHKSKINFK